MAPVGYKIYKLYAEKSANLLILKCASYFRTKKSVVFQVPCVQVIWGSLSTIFIYFCWGPVKPHEREEYQAFLFCMIWLLLPPPPLQGSVSTC